MSNASLLVNVIHTGSGQLNKLKFRQLSDNCSVDFYLIRKNNISVFAALNND